jgi:serine/threonine protein kinase
VETRITLNHRYTLGPQIAQGQICSVYLGTDQTLHRKVAIKVVPATHAASYRQAVHSAACLSHAHIVGLFDVYNEGAELSIIQEYIEGQSFTTVRRAGLPFEAIIAIGEQLAQALAYAHRHGVIHGDLTPQAIFLNHSGNVKVNNFGLPPDDRYFQAMATVIATMMEGMPVPSTSAIQPSQDEDVRAIGFLLYQLVTPHPDALAHVNLPPALFEVIARAIVRDHPRRIATAAALLAALQACRSELEMTQIGQMPTQGLTQPQELTLPRTAPLLRLPQRAAGAPRQMLVAPAEAPRSVTALARALPVLVIGLLLFTIFFGIGYYLPLFHH